VLTLPSSVGIDVAAEPVDMRKVTARRKRLGPGGATCADGFMRLPIRQLETSRAIGHLPRRSSSHRLQQESLGSYHFPVRPRAIGCTKSCVDVPTSKARESITTCIFIESGRRRPTDHTWRAAKGARMMRRDGNGWDRTFAAGVLILAAGFRASGRPANPENGSR